MVKATTKTPLSAPPRRKQTLSDAHKKEKGRSRNACDRCKQKKVKCDGEGQRVCSICREGDYQCTYAQRPHDEKRQYRKGYVEMVEEANNYYKNGLHEFYRRFQDAEMFKRLRTKYSNGGAPTVQEIMTALGMPSTGKAHEGGIPAITAQLEQEGRPMLVRRGEWDREEGTHRSPALSHEEEMDDASEGSSDENEASARSHSPIFEPTSQSSSVTTHEDASRRASAYYLSALDSFGAGSGSDCSSPQEEFLDYTGSSMPFYSPMGDFFPNNVFGDLNTPPQSAGLVAPQQMPSMQAGAGTVQLRDVQMNPLDELMNTGSLAASLYRTGHFDDRLIADLRRGNYVA